MKYIKIISILLISINSIAQQTIKPVETVNVSEFENNVYFKDINGVFNKYLGSWIHDDGNNYFKIIFYKIEMFDTLDIFQDGSNPNKSFEDKILSKYIFKQNGVTLYDTTSYDSNSKEAWFITNLGFENLSKLRFTYNEPTNTSCKRKLKGELTIEHQSLLGNNEQLIFNRTTKPIHGDFDWTCPDGVIYDTTPFLIPANMTLIKQ